MAERTDPLSSHGIDCPCDVCTRRRANRTHPAQEALSRARDARRRVYAEDRRLLAARALDRYLGMHTGAGYRGEAAFAAAGDEFIERVGDYVEARLQHNRHYGVTSELGPHMPTDCPGSECALYRQGLHRSPDYGADGLQSAHERHPWHDGMCAGVPAGQWSVVCSELPGCHDGEHSASCEVALHVPRVEGP